MSTNYAAHRGYKAQYPENTLPAFQAAYDANCQVIETDLHITLDKEVIIAHDIDTNRVFGEDYIITQTPWKGHLEHLLTLKEPRSPIPLFKDVLDWVTTIWDNGGEIKLMLDIKADNDPQTLYELIWEIFKDCRGADYWKNKIIWGLWNTTFLLPDFIIGWEVINITFDIDVSIDFHRAANEKGIKLHSVSIFSMIMYDKTEGSKLIAWSEENDVKIWFWTLNKYQEVLNAIKFCNDGTLLEGVVTDDPKAVMHDPGLQEYMGLSYQIKWWMKKKLYLWFLYFSRRRYNLRPIFKILQKIGFI